jgi:hypothetical protein
MGVGAAAKNDRADFGGFLRRRRAAMTPPDRPGNGRTSHRRVPGLRRQEVQAPDTEIRPGLLRLLRNLENTMPVTVHDGRLDLLARNAAAADLFGPLSGSGWYGRNIVHQCFTAPALCHVLGEEGADQLSRVATAELRSALGRYPGDEYCWRSCRRPAPPSVATGSEARSERYGRRRNACITRPKGGWTSTSRCCTTPKGTTG